MICVCELFKAVGIKRRPQSIMNKQKRQNRSGPDVFALLNFFDLFLIYRQ
jgi:hypothetical protein